MEKIRFTIPNNTKLVFVRAERFYLPGFLLRYDNLKGEALVYLQHKVVLCDFWSEDNVFTLKEVLFEGVSSELCVNELNLTKKEKDLLYEKCEIVVR